MYIQLTNHINKSMKVTEDDLNNTENHDSYLTNKDDEVTESIQAADLEEDDSEQNSGIEHATNQDIATFGL
ncbi:Uncharacterised protein [Staphylococcus gallinarum]|uniref:Uncharacterized protein n=1 Tax=Staphylococcus gallinarum TaxID=1293 RepID=A0A380FJH9_STAGA|nr:Uncharacterised protein [Staphylococcus gallinarum]